jgi:hypothetical protein
LTPMEAGFCNRWDVHIVEDAGDVPAVIIGACGRGNG